MIEYRAILRKDLSFESGFKLIRGTVVYARETPHGWLGSYYDDKGGGRAFALGDEDFSIMQSADCQVEYMVVMPDPPEAPEKLQREAELARRRLERKAERHREEADAIEKLLGAEV